MSTNDDIDITLSPDDFRVPANDSQGHSERAWFRLQPGHDRQIETVVGSKAFPYRSKGDVIRHAVRRHLEWLETLAPIPSVTIQVDAVLEIMREEEFNEDFRQVFDRMGERIGVYVASGQIDRAKVMVAKVRPLIERMPDSAWRDQYLSELQSRFGYLMEEVNVADLTGGTV